MIDGALNIAPQRFNAVYCTEAVDSTRQVELDHHSFRHPGVDVEGVGATRRELAPMPYATVWVETTALMAMKRTVALDRDPPGFVRDWIAADRTSIKSSRGRAPQRLCPVNIPSHLANCAPSAGSGCGRSNRMTGQARQGPRSHNNGLACRETQPYAEGLGLGEEAAGVADAHQIPHVQSHGTHANDVPTA